MTTINAVDTTLSGQSGTGSFAGTTSPIFVTPILGAATGTSLTFSPSTSGIIGTTTNNSASAGVVGEYINSTILSGSAISISNSVAKDLTTISLTAGDWFLYGNISFIASGPNISELFAWISTTSATVPDASQASAITGTSLGSTNLVVPQLRFSLSSTTTIYISGVVTFGAGTVNICGMLSARRIR